MVLLIKGQSGKQGSCQQDFVHDASFMYCKATKHDKYRMIIVQHKRTWHEDLLPHGNRPRIICVIST